jgi:hypothetical protein
MTIIKDKRGKKVETGDKLTDNLYEAVRAYIEARNGSVVVIGGVAIVEEGLKFNYGLMVRITGKKPVFIKK